MVRKIFLTFLVTITLLFSSLDSRGQAKQPYLFFLGVEQYLIGSKQRAHDFFIEVVKVNPTHSPSYYYLSVVAASLGEQNMAQIYIDNALAIDPTNTLYLGHKVQLHLDKREYLAADKLITQLRILEPTDRRNYTLGAALMMQVHKFEEARKLSEEYEALFGIDEQMVEIQRVSYLATNSYYSAESYMRRVVSAYPQNSKYLIALAEINAMLKLDSVAIATFDMAISLDPTAEAPLLSKAEFYKQKGETANYIDALVALFLSRSVEVSTKVALFKKDFLLPAPYREHYARIEQLISALLTTHPDDYEVRMLYGYFLTYTGHIDTAEEHYKTMLDEGIAQEELIGRVMEIYFYGKKYDSAAEVAHTAYLKYGTSTYLESEAVAYWLNADNDRALSKLKEGIRHFESDSIRSSLYAMQGDIYESMGEMKRCYALYKRALKHNPDNAVVLNNYAYFLSLEDKDLDMALEMARRANILSPDNATYLDTEAWVLFVMGHYVDAQMLMRRVFALDGNPSGEVLMHYGDILYALGDDFLARNYWRKAVEAGADVDDIEERALRPKAVRGEE